MMAGLGLHVDQRKGVGIVFPLLANLRLIMGKKTSSQLNSRDTFRANLPVPLTSFIGRERELAEVTDSLARTRLLTLIGAGGCGKTRLALQLAKDTADSFPDRLWAVELPPLCRPV